MDSSFAISGPYRLTSVPPYILVQSTDEGSITFGPTHKESSLWRKFIRKSKLRSQTDPTMTAIPVTKTTTEGPTILKQPTLSLEELLSGPLFRVAGMFEID